jgi:hypothetical protein
MLLPPSLSEKGKSRTTVCNNNVSVDKRKVPSLSTRQGFCRGVSVITLLTVWRSYSASKCAIYRSTYVPQHAHYCAAATTIKQKIRVRYIAKAVYFGDIETKWAMHYSLARLCALNGKCKSHLNMSCTGTKKPSDVNHWVKDLSSKIKQKTQSVTMNTCVLFCRDILYRVRRQRSARYWVLGRKMPTPQIHPLNFWTHPR